MLIQVDNLRKLIPIFISVVILLLFSCTEINKLRIKPSAVNGILDLREWDFHRDGIAELNGEWKFRWMEDNPAFSEEKFDDSGWETLKVPGTWNSKTGTPYGAGWVRLKILIPPGASETYAGRLSIQQINEIFSAYEIYVNGKVVIHSGRVSSSYEQEIPDFKPVIKPLELDSMQSVITVAVKISNYNFIMGGFHGAPAIGLKDAADEKYYQNEAVNYIVLGILLMMIIYHLFLWMARRDDLSSLLFAFFCLAPLCRLIYLGNIAGRFFQGYAYYSIHHKFSFAAIPLLFIFTPSFFALLFPEEFSRRILRFFQIAGAVILLFIIAAEVRVFSRFMLVYEVVLAVMLVWIIVSIVRAFLNKKNEAWLILSGMVIVFAAVINDLLFSFGTINTGFYSQFGFIALIFCQSTALSLRFARTYRTAAHLSLYLKDEVDRKTADLTLRTKEAEDAKQEIQEANKILLEMDNYKNLFFQNITHEFRTPLTLIIGYIERTLDKAHTINTDELIRQYNIVLSNARRLLKLINQILDISKIDAQMMQFKEESFDLARLIRSVMLSFESVSSAKNIKMTGYFEPDIIPGMFDKEKIEKIMYNLLSNAFKFTGNGGEVIVSVISDGSNIEISVKDNGPGVDSAMLPKIFNRFYQADNSLTRNYEGTGIGLSIVKEYVEMHDGEIDVSSIPGTGTVFKIALPVKKIEADNIQYDCYNYAPETESGNASLYISDFSQESFKEEIFSRNAVADGRDLILIVDDNSDIRSFIRDVLSDTYAVIEADNGVSGLRKVHLCRPDLVISDIMMPEMDGYQMLKEIKGNPESALIPVVLLTAKADESGKAEGLDAGADDYLSKPFSAKELIARVKSLLKLYNFQKIIIERNKEIEADLDIARIIQSKLMLEGYNSTDNENFSVLFYPLDKVAGDFYNIIEDDESVKIFIADVSGHGLASAFLALITKNELDNTITRSSDTLSVLDHLNMSVSRYSVRCNFVTAFFCIYNRKTGILKYSKAGHNPPILCRKSDNSITELSTYGRALGFFPDIKFEEKEISLETGDRIIFYTDGLIEISDKSGEMFGLDRLISFIIENRRFTPAEFSDKLMSNIVLFAMGEAFEDDVTLLVYDIP